MPDVASLVLSGAVAVSGISIGSIEMLEDVVRLVAKKELVPLVEKEFGFSHEGVLKAYEYLEAAGHVGKVCINVL